jgi:hypothetical protein
MDDGFCPGTWRGTPEKFTRHDVYPWVKKLPVNKNIFCLFWANWHNKIELPDGYDYYIISYQVENIDIEWLTQQQKKHKGQFIVLHPGYSYNFKLDNTTFITYTSLHHDLDKMISWWGINPIPTNKKYKFSTICNRITQGKIWVTTKLLETAREDSLIVLNSWLELKNVHNWQLTGNANLDKLTDTYRTKYQTLELKDDFDQKIDNIQQRNSNPYQPVYSDCALHFVAGSFHYSQMSDYIWPGPDIDEKTLKCLLGGVAFIPCAQFETYKFLQDLGLEFNYDFDLNWDQDPGNITRFDSICRLINDLTQYSPETLVAKTQESTNFNRNFILDKKFYNNCERLNQQSLDQLFSLFT